MRCTYCYLPSLGDRSRMEPDIPQRLAVELAAEMPHPVEIRWHGGEPLTVGAAHFERLLEPFEPMRRAGRLQHSLQTNSTLIDDEWCSLFERYGVRVGVSIDGPRWANSERRTLSGAETYERALAGITLLRQHGVPFSTIAVVSLATIPTIVARVDEYLAFFRSIGTREVGFNVEEHEGRHLVAPSEPGIVNGFWRAVFDAWERANCTPVVREFATVLAFGSSSLGGKSEEQPIDPCPTVAWNGDVVLLSPELSGHHDERYADFTVGNLRDEPLLVLLEKGFEAPYVLEFREGTKACQRDCRYFEYCRGGQACNRYFEHGDFVTNETDFCRNSRQLPFDAVLGLPATQPSAGQHA